MSKYRIEARLIVSSPHSLPMDECPITIHCDEDKTNAWIALDDALYGVVNCCHSLNVLTPALAYDAILGEAATAFEFDQARAVRNDDGAVIFVVSVVLGD